MLRDPVGTLGPIINHLAEKKAKEILDSSLSGYSEKQSWNQFVQQNQGWMVEQDSKGRVVMDPMTSMPRMTPAGQQFGYFVSRLQAAGVTDANEQRALALELVSRGLEQAAGGQQQQPPPAKGKMVNGAARRSVNHAAAPAATASGEAAPGSSLREALANALRDTPEDDLHF